MNVGRVVITGLVAAVLFLVSQRADYITGMTLNVNGGMFM